MSESSYGHGMRRGAADFRRVLKEDEGGAQKDQNLLRVAHVPPPSLDPIDMSAAMWSCRLTDNAGTRLVIVGEDHYATDQKPTGLAVAVESGAVAPRDVFIEDSPWHTATPQSDGESELGRLRSISGVHRIDPRSYAIVSMSVEGMQRVWQLHGFLDQESDEAMGVMGEAMGVLYEACWRGLTEAIWRFRQATAPEMRVAFDVAADEAESKVSSEYGATHRCVRDTANVLRDAHSRLADWPMATAIITEVRSGTVGGECYFYAGYEHAMGVADILMSVGWNVEGGGNVV